MHTAPAAAPDAACAEDLAQLERDVARAAHTLPAQGPITTFVHHNTLHAFEDESFEDAVQRAGRLYGCEAFLPEAEYRDLLRRGRIRLADLRAVVRESLDESAAELPRGCGSLVDVRMAMLEHRLAVGGDSEIRWAIAESDALGVFHRGASAADRQAAMDETRRWVLRDLGPGGECPAPEMRDALERLRLRLGREHDSWGEAAWETATLELIWAACRHGARLVRARPPAAPPSLRHRDALAALGAEDPDPLVDEVLTRFCAVFLDQGFANWPLPGRDAGFFAAFAELHARPGGSSPLLVELARELRRVREAGITPRASLAESLSDLGVSPEERVEFFEQTFAAFRGWPGALHQLETNAEWVVHPAPPGTLVEYLAVRLLVERVALRLAAARLRGPVPPLSELRDAFRARRLEAPTVGRLRSAFRLFQVAQLRGWSAARLARLSPAEWELLVEAVVGFASPARRLAYHLAYERRYRDATLDALVQHAGRVTHRDVSPPFQLVTCLDEREESFRRHLEEVDPRCETLGVAGFFGVAMYYRGATEAHYRPLCPVSVKPAHHVDEVPVFSVTESSRRRARARRHLGSAAHSVHRGTRSFTGGVLTALAGSLATLPLVMRVLLPRTAARLRRAVGEIVKPPLTELRLAREEASESDGRTHGYTPTEMAAIVEGVLTSLGLRRRCARLVLIVGHGSASLNNPHEAAHDCGACGGGRGGPNARAFALMANDPRVRALLVERGCPIPDDSVFVGAYHNTCDDSMSYADVDDLPYGHRALFDEVRRAVAEACRRNAHERCRRFESAPLGLSPAAALQHVEARAEDLSQTRPEFGHATNALCFVGRRQWSRGLFLDRRAFLTSYDPTEDDEQGSTLEALLGAVIPVCAGINLEYYFSRVDPTGYGCGTKLPHNITGLIGVMDGAASDLRPGLPWQMVEIHEPVRLLFVIETTQEVLSGILERNPAIDRLVRHRWVQLAMFDPRRARAEVFTAGRFVPHEPASDALPVVASSAAWYRGQRDHLAFASVRAEELRA